MDPTPPSSVTLPPSLEQVRVARLPSDAYYIADFITEEEEAFILEKIAAAPKPRWKHLTHRRLQTWPADLVQQNTLLDAPLPQWLTDPIVDRLLSIPILDATSSSNIFSASPHKRPNHVLINEYPPGVGIMPHKDGAAYHPVVCTISLGASLCLDIYKSKDDGAVEPDACWRVLQEPRSLLITTKALYTEYLHGIANVEQDSGLSDETVANWSLLRSRDSFASGVNSRQVRTSLTYRDVLKVSKLGSKLGLLAKR